MGRLLRLSDLGYQLEAFAGAVDVEQFPSELDQALVIQTVNTLSDERTEYLNKDRLSFMLFLEPWSVGASAGRQDDLAILGAIAPLFAEMLARFPHGPYDPGLWL